MVFHQIINNRLIFSQLQNMKNDTQLIPWLSKQQVILSGLATFR